MVEVSVVVPTHNRRRLLSAALHSALQQRDVDLEVVVVDDGSTDGTPVALAEVLDDRLRLVRHDHPNGVAAARNAGSEAARGTWVAFLDDDDLWAPTKLVLQLAAAQRDSTGWVYAGAVEISADGRLLGGSPAPPPKELVAGLRRRNRLPAGSSNVLVRAEVLRQVGGFDPGLRHLADWDLWLRLAGHSVPGFVNAPLVAYRQHPGQATLDTTGMVAEARILAARHRADPVSVHRWAAWSCLRSGRRRTAVAAYANAIAARDLSSIGRAAVAVLHPCPARARRPSFTRPDLHWQLEAERWLKEFAAGVATASEGPPIAGDRRDET
jgi:glycosyltransferase involved in cell wall biosynthesis